MVLITGGARVGKTKLAINVCKSRGPNILYLTTGKPSDDFFEQEMMRRIRKQRPSDWVVREAYHSIDSILDEEGAGYDAILIESIRGLIANLMDNFGYINANSDFKAITRNIIEEINKLILAAKRIHAQVIFITNEVNIHPVETSEAFKAQMDILGRVNQQLAALSNEMYYVVSGIPIKLK